MSDSFPYTSEAEHVKCHYEVGENKLHSEQLYRYTVRVRPQISFFVTDSLSAKRIRLAIGHPPLST